MVWFTFGHAGASWLFSGCSERRCSSWQRLLFGSPGSGSCGGTSPDCGERVSPVLAGGFSTTEPPGEPPVPFHYSSGYFLVYSIYTYLCVYTLKKLNTVWQTIFFLLTAYNGYWDNWTSIIFLKSVYCTFSALVFWVLIFSSSYWLPVYTFYLYYFNVCC